MRIVVVAVARLMGTRSAALGIVGGGSVGLPTLAVSSNNMDSFHEAVIKVKKPATRLGKLEFHYI